jgi:hypothetical protein
MDLSLQSSIPTAIAGLNLLRALLGHNLVPNKKLVFTRLSCSPALLIADAAVPFLNVSVDGKKIDDPHLLSMTISNNGDIPILPKDVFTPITIEWPGSMAIEMVKLDCPGCTDGSSRGIRIVKGAVRVEPLLWNAGDVVSFSVLLSGRPSKATIRGQIVGTRFVFN